MKNTYEGMFIFPKTLGEEALEKALNDARAEIEQAGGEVGNVTRLGKRAFARPLKKQDAGYYAVIVFDIDGSEIERLRARFKLNENVLRVQFVKLENTDEESGGGDAGEGKAS